MDRYARQREEMVDGQLRGRGIADPGVLNAMLDVPRHAFVPQHLRDYAYNDYPLPIGDGQTISQPYMVALMTEALELKPESRLLEIGTGSGYAAAVASRIAAEVFTVERLPSLAGEAEVLLQSLGYSNIHVLCGDGTLGWPDHAPFDAISVTAGAPEIPAPLLDQLAPGGRLVIPVGRFPLFQELVRVRRSPSGLQQEELCSVRFVPLVGEKGWNEPVAHFFRK